MNFKLWLEMPIRSFNLVGNWKDEPAGSKKRKLGYYGDDFGILTNKAAQEKIRRKWGKTEQDFDMYFVRNPKASKVREVGEVSKEFLHGIGLDVDLASDAVTVVFTNNMGTERIPMNWWALAHRFSHAIRRTKAFEYFSKTFDRYLFQMLKEIYRYNKKSIYGLGGDEKMLRNVANMIGTMKSARDHKLVNYYEFHHELVAQFIVEGRVRFNPPTQLVVGHAWGRPQHLYGDNKAKEEWAEHLVDSVAEEVSNDISHMIHQCVGKAFLI